MQAAARDAVDGRLPDNPLAPALRFHSVLRYPWEAGCRSSLAAREREITISRARASGSRELHSDAYRAQWNNPVVRISEAAIDLSRTVSESTNRIL